MKRILTLLAGVLMLGGVAFQSDLLPRLIALENRVTSLEIVLLTPTVETFPTATPTPNLVLARNDNSVNVRVRQAATTQSAILGLIAPDSTVLLCIGEIDNGWQRVASGGWVSVQFLVVTNEVSFGMCE